MKGAFVYPNLLNEDAFFKALHQKQIALTPEETNRALEVAKVHHLEALLFDTQKHRAKAFAQAAMRQEAVALISEALSDVAHVFFKGALIDPLLFGGVGKRGSCDVDLTILPADFKEVDARLQALNYRPKNESAFEARSKEHTYRGGEGFAELDLHLSFLNRWALHDESARIIARSKVYDTAWGPMRGPEEHDMFALMAGNLAIDRVKGRIKFGVDACALLAQCQIDFERVFALCERARCLLGLYALLRMLAERFSKNVAPEILARTKPSFFHAKHIDKLLGLMAFDKNAGPLKSVVTVDWALSDAVTFPLLLAREVMKAKRHA